MTEAELQPCMWPAKDEPGEFVAACSCERWRVQGTIAEINRASQQHDDAPFAQHIAFMLGKVKDQ